jgi:hypothetical protein
VLHNVGYPTEFRCESFADICDGSSNTLMVGEMASHSHQSRRTFWAYSYTSYNASAATAQSRILLVDYDKCVAIGGAGGANPCKRGWGSYHNDGLHFVLCDGSARFISTGIDMNLFCDISTIDGGEVAVIP